MVCYGHALGKILRVHVHKDATVKQLKEETTALAAALHLPPSTVDFINLRRVVFQGHFVDDEDFLDDLGVDNGRYNSHR